MECNTCLNPTSLDTGPLQQVPSNIQASMYHARQSVREVVVGEEDIGR